LYPPIFLVSAPHFFIFVWELKKFKDIRLIYNPRQKCKATKRNVIGLARFFFRTSHFYTLRDGRKSN
jgi:hypothetical protein